ncbi:MAG: hypothetical protein ABI859_07900 [Pseudomonadota bacterium]
MKRPAGLRGGASCAVLALLGWAGPAVAIDRIALHIDSIQAAGVIARDIDVQLVIAADAHSVATLSVAQMQLPAALLAQTGAVTQVTLRCTDPLISEPRFACPAFAASLRAARLPPLGVQGSADLRSDSGSIAIKGNGPVIAGKALQFDLNADSQRWAIKGTLPQVAIADLRLQVQPWYALPKDLVLDGRLAATLNASGNAQGERADVTARVTDVNLQNAAATIIAEKLAGALQATVNRNGTAFAFDTKLQGEKGQMLVGPVLLDFNVNASQVAARGRYVDGVVEVAALNVTQRNLSDISGTAEVQLQPLLVRTARLELGALNFPAAYTSFLQISLATTPFGTLVTTGSASGAITIKDNLPTQLDLNVRGLNLQDDSRHLQVVDVNSELHWTAGLTGPPRPSQLSWETSRGWNIEGGRTRIDFATQDRDFRLLKAARLPFFDGAVLINTMEARNIGSDKLEGAFDAVIEPISMTPVSKALGLPEFSGVLAGRVPGLTYKDSVLSVQGDLEAQVFDGRVVASNLKVRDPFGAWPRLYADIVARNLDLDLITRTFEFGSITGRLNADVQGLETFNWSPVAFNFVLATPPGDKSRHRISQKALKNLTSIGGGGGGVAAALQSGALRFFDDFRYDRIGLSCRLRNDVCQMNGVAPAANGFYIVKGSGIPRIDIIGNQNRVDWPLLMAQIAAAVANSGDIVVN